MRKYCLVLGIAGALASASVETRAQEPAASLTTTTVPAATPTATVPPAEASKTPPQTTIVHGTLPDLRGRWLMMFDLRTDGGYHRNIPSFLDIDTTAGQLEVIEHFVNFPDAMHVEMSQANDAGSLWEPTTEQRAEIARRWAELGDAERGIAKVANELWGKDGFDDAIRKESDVAGAEWVFRQVYSFLPGGQRPVRQVNVYGAMKPDGDGWRGRAVVTVVAAAPFPIPITYKGDFHLIRVGDPLPRGLLARLLDAFRGCGR